MYIRLCFLFIFFAFALSSSGQQTREEIQKRQQELQNELNNLNNTLSSIKKDKSRSLSQLALVRKKIAAREEMINILNKDLQILSDNIYLTNLDITRYKRELDTLKDKYAKSLIFAYKNRSNYDYLNFIFSAQSFNDAVKRIAYLKSYREYRQTQVNNIKKTEQLLQTKIAEFNNKRLEKNQTIIEQSKQLTVLENDKKEKDEVVHQLKGKESQLAKELRRREAERKKLQQSLAAVIRREVEAAKKEAARREAEERKKAAAAAAANAGKETPSKPGTPTASKPEAKGRVYSALESTEEGMMRSINFEKNKGNLPWPVESGIVVGEFGIHKVAGMEINEANDGIRIETPETRVKSVADGVVNAVMDLGEFQAVVVQHGKYFTIYSNLSNVSVNRGQNVQAGTVIGTAALNWEGVREILFSVSNENGKFINPNLWLKRK